MTSTFFSTRPAKIITCGWNFSKASLELRISTAGILVDKDHNSKVSGLPESQVQPLCVSEETEVE